MCRNNAVCYFVFVGLSSFVKNTHFEAHSLHFLEPLLLLYLAQIRDSFQIAFASESISSSWLNVDYFDMVWVCIFIFIYLSYPLFGHGSIVQKPTAQFSWNLQSTVATSCIHTTTEAHQTNRKTLRTYEKHLKKNTWEKRKHGKRLIKIKVKHRTTRDNKNNMKKYKELWKIISGDSERKKWE